MLLLSRRQLLKAVTKGLIAWPAYHALKPAFTLAQSQGGTSRKNLIILNLEGGFDHLAAFPYHDQNGGDGGIAATLRQIRPELYVTPPSDLRLPNSNYIGFSESFRSLFPEYQNSRLLLLQSMGISPGSHPGGSHNFCQNVYSFGSRNITPSSRAWLARFIDMNSLERTFGFGTLGRVDFNTERRELSPIVGLRAEDMRFADPFSSARANVNLDFSRRFLDAGAPSRTAQERAIEAALRTSNQTLTFMNQVAQQPLVNAGLFPASAAGDAFKSITRTILHLEAQNDARPRLFYAFQGGFDTHANQSSYLSSHFRSVSDSLAAMVHHLRLAGVYDRTMVLVISEFGRTAAQNGGVGTDHGWGTTLFALGGAVNGGRVLGEPPQPAYMQSNNECRALTDFRNMYKEALDWLGLPYGADDVIAPATYQPQALNLVRGGAV